jgi:hypothetical protein
MRYDTTRCASNACDLCGYCNRSHNDKQHVLRMPYGPSGSSSGMQCMHDSSASSNSHVFTPPYIALNTTPTTTMCAHTLTLTATSSIDLLVRVTSRLAPTAASTTDVCTHATSYRHQ